MSLTLACVAALAQTATVPQEQPPVHHNFTEVATGKGIPSGGAVQASVHSYRSEDGSAVVQVRQWYKSPSDAGRALDRLTKRASHVIKQSKKDVKGHIIGNRVELVFNRGHKASAEIVIAWTDGSTVVRLSSTSLPLLLDFESQYYP